jgi:hypothetical protein
VRRLLTRRREALALVSVLLALALALAFMTRLTTPKQHAYGSVWGHFLQEEPDSEDVLFFGSSLVYCDVAPAALWETTGLSSFVMAGPEQTIPMTALYLREALRTQSPQAVFVELTGMFYHRCTNYTKTNVGQMPWGYNRLAATFTEAEPEVRAGLLFPLLFYHDRWSELTADDWTVALRGYSRDPLAGYTCMRQWRPSEGFQVRPPERDPENFERSWASLVQIRDLCLSRGIIPVFYVAPTLLRVRQADMDALLARVRALEGARVLDGNAVFDSPGLDESYDFYDSLHLNVAGARKFTEFLGGWIRSELALRPAAARDAALWRERSEYLRALEAQPLEQWKPKES